MPIYDITNTAIVAIRWGDCPSFRTHSAATTSRKYGPSKSPRRDRTRTTSPRSGPLRDRSGDVLARNGRNRLEVGRIREAGSISFEIAPQWEVSSVAGGADETDSRGCSPAPGLLSTVSYSLPSMPTPEASTAARARHSLVAGCSFAPASSEFLPRWRLRAWATCVNACYLSLLHPKSIARCGPKLARTGSAALEQCCAMRKAGASETTEDTKKGLAIIHTCMPKLSSVPSHLAARGPSPPPSPPPPPCLHPHPHPHPQAKPHPYPLPHPPAHRTQP